MGRGSVEGVETGRQRETFEIQCSPMHTNGGGHLGRGLNSRGGALALLLGLEGVNFGLSHFWWGTHQTESKALLFQPTIFLRTQGNMVKIKRFQDGKTRPSWGRSIVSGFLRFPLSLGFPLAAF